MKLPKLLTDLYTGPDGSTWAIGRVYSAPTLISGLVVPFVMILKGQTIDLAALGMLYGGVGAAVMALVTGTNHTEPKAGE